jgi:uncharacterized C2H2 Zn-finger protein
MEQGVNEVGIVEGEVERVACKHCCLSFPSAGEYDRHRRVVHQLRVVVAFKPHQVPKHVEHLQREDDGWMRLEIARNQEREMFACPACGGWYETAKLLRRHMEGAARIRKRPRVRVEKMTHSKTG